MTVTDEMEGLARSLVDQIRDLAVGIPADGETIPISARTIGLLCFTFVETSGAPGYIPRDRLHEFEERACRLKEAGNQASIRYEAVMDALPPLYRPPPNVRHFPTPILYERRRTELAKRFVELEEELRAASEGEVSHDR